jgi:dynein heavy chain
MFLDENDKIPFPALKYLTAECNYGGRVTDDKDRRLIVTLLDDYFNDNVLNDKSYKFGPEDSFKVPKLSTHQEYIEHIQTLPHLIHPNVFGFHSSADITKDINETNLLLDSILLCSSEASGGEGHSQESLL